VVDTFPLYSRSDQALLGIGDAYLGEAHSVQMMPNLPGALRERLRAVYQDRAAEAFAKVITRYPMAPHVEDARDRLVAMNRPVPEPTEAAIAESDAEEKSRQPLHFTDKTLGVIKHGPSVVEAVHVGEPSLTDPKRTLAPDVTKQNVAIFNDAVNAGRPAPLPGAVKPTGVNEPPRSDQPSQAPLQMEAPAGGTGVGVQIVSAPAADPNAVIKPVGPVNTVLPAAEKPAAAPDQVNDVKPGTTPAQSATDARKKKPKADLSDESSSKKKKKKGVSKLNPF
jgi:outer membrane protein assembly factor BamD